MANKAYVFTTGMGYYSLEPGVQIECEATVIEEDGTLVVSRDGFNVRATWSDDHESIHQIIAGAIRARQADETLVVVFLDAPGVY